MGGRERSGERGMEKGMKEREVKEKEGRERENSDRGRGRG
jgi:hypothetical protein